VLETENDLLRFLFHSYLLVCTFTPVAAHPQCSYVKINLVKQKTCETAVLTISRSNLQGSCAWDEKVSSAIWSSSLSALLRFHACSPANSVLLCSKTPRVCQKNHVKEPYCKPAQNGRGKDVALETVYDSLQFTYHRLLIFCVLAPVAARPQCSYVKINLEYVQRDLEYAKRSMRKSRTDHKS
jgi:hypothetical protein